MKGDEKKITMTYQTVEDDNIFTIFIHKSICSIYISEICILLYLILEIRNYCKLKAQISGNMLYNTLKIVFLL